MHMEGTTGFPHPGKSEPHLFISFAVSGAQLHQRKHLGHSLQQILSYYNERPTQESCSLPAPNPFPAHSSWSHLAPAVPFLLIHQWV